MARTALPSLWLGFFKNESAFPNRKHLPAFSRGGESGSRVSSGILGHRVLRFLC